MSEKLPASYRKAQAAAAAFDANREALAAQCRQDRNSGMTLQQVADKLNEQGLRTKTGKAWTPPNVLQLVKNPKPPVPQPKSQAAATREKRAKRKYGLTRRNDPSLAWVAAHPELEKWRELGVQWLKGKEVGLSHALTGLNVFLDYLIDNKLPAEPAELLLFRTSVPDMYETTWGKHRTHGKVLLHNLVHSFLEWVLTQPQFCAEDDDGRLRTSPAFRNPVPHLSRSGLPRHVESVRGTLPYGYIEELRKMIAEGPNFRDWKWAQSALGLSQAKLAKGGSQRKTHEPGENEGDMIAPVWFEVDPSQIDKADPDCVWRIRTRVIPGVPGRRGGGRKTETVYEMWSPVRWVALLIKLQLPLRTFQVRMLDSGEADTWNWKEGEWTLNQGALALGSESQPHSNGIFLRPNRLVDGDAKVLLHINTNKTADIGKDGNQKGYNVPWMVGGPIHQDPFYWLEKLRKWQEKYNPLKRLTRWDELDGRHFPIKSDVQLAAYPDTAFLFRTPETVDNPHFPLTALSMERPWFLCLECLEQRLASRGEVLPRGGRIRLLPDQEVRKKNASTTLFSLHSLRVSLITALALDGEIPLAILQKIAGHSRLVMTLYYTKPGAQQAREALQAGVQRLNESAGDTIVDWLANTEYTQLVKEVIANSPEAFAAAIPQLVQMRSPAGWMVMVDGLCLVGGNNSESDAPGCHNGGPNIGNDSVPKYAPTPGGARNCPRCRWFITRPFFLPQLAARWNNAIYHCTEAKQQVVLAEERFRELEDRRAAALAADEVFNEQRQYSEAERSREQAIKKFDDLTMNVAAITRLLERCRQALNSGDGTALVANGGLSEFEYVIEEVDSELLQLSGVCEGSVLYPDLDPGKAVLRQSQLLDAALMRDDMPPVFLMLSEEEQKLVGSAAIRNLAEQMNPQNPALGRYQVISLIDARKSLRQVLGPAVEQALKLAVTREAPHRVIPIKALPEPVEAA